MSVYVSCEDRVWYIGDVFDAVCDVGVGCFVVCGCGVSRGYVNVCNCDVLSSAKVYLDYL